MTLVLTELSSFGIAMAADSAVTHIQTQTGLSNVTPNAARKLQIIPHLNAGISCWGIGAITDIPTDEWLSNFINSNTSLNTLQSFANELARQLNAQVPPNTSGTNRLGFHLAAFENCNGIQMPSFFHIHDGPSTTLEKRGITNVNPYKFNANHDMPPEIFQQDLYLFSWDEILGNDNERLIESLIHKFSIDWVKIAKIENIEKFDDDKTIIVTTGKKVVSLRLNNEKTKVNVKFDDDSNVEFTVKLENNRLNIYQDSSNDRFYITRNGDYRLYAHIFARLKQFFRQLEPLGIKIPSSQNLLDRADYLVFQIRTMSEIYRLSNLVPGIGGGIYYLTINQNGIHSHGIRYF